jgi:hypothetical protein
MASELTESIGCDASATMRRQLSNWVTEPINRKRTEKMWRKRVDYADESVILHTSQESSFFVECLICIIQRLWRPLLKWRPMKKLEFH